MLLEFLLSTWIFIELVGTFHIHPVLIFIGSYILIIIGLMFSIIGYIIQKNGTLKDVCQGLISVLAIAILLSLILIGLGIIILMTINYLSK